MRAAAGANPNPSSGGWADDWTVALERPSFAARSAEEPLASPSIITNTRASIAAVGPAAPRSPRGAFPNPLPDTAADDASPEREPFPEPFPMHYCSAAERDEWAAVLRARDPADPGPDQWPPPPSPHTGAPNALTDLKGAATLDHPGAAAEAPGVAAFAAAAVTREAATAATGAAAGMVAAAVAAGGAAVPAASVTVPLKPAPAIVDGCGWRLGGGGGGSGGVVLAAIELGSHCTRALLHDGSHELARLTYDTMLGQPSAQQDGCGRSSSSSSGGCGDFHPDALQRTLDALQRVMEAATAFAAAAAVAATGAAGKADEIAAGATLAALDPAVSSGRRLRIAARMVATAAVRNASDGSRTALAEAAERLVGCPLEVLTGEDEGRLAWRGVVGGLQCLTPSGCGGAAAATSQLHKDQEQQHQQLRQRRLLVVDLGGRSTEFVYGHSRADQPVAVSLPLGCVGLHATACRLAADAAGGGGGDSAVSEPDSPSLEALGACVRIARQMVERLRARMPWPLTPHPGATAADACGMRISAPNPAAGSAVASAAAAATASSSDASPVLQPSNSMEGDTAVGAASGGSGGDAVVIFTGGTVTTLAALHQRLPYYDRARVHGSLLTSYDIAAMMAHLATAEGRAAALESYDWLTEARCRTLAAGCAGLLGVMAALGVEQVTVSDADLLDGLLADMLDDFVC